MRQGKTEQSIARCLTSLGSSSHFEWGAAGEPCDTAAATVFLGGVWGGEGVGGRGARGARARDDDAGESAQRVPWG